MLAPDPARSPGLTLRSFLNKIGIDKVGSELSRLKSKLSNVSDMSINLKSISKEDHDESDCESEILI